MSETEPEPAKAQPPESKPASRRLFLAISAGGAVLAGAGAGLTWLLRKDGVEAEVPEPMSETGETLAGLIRERLDELVELPDATVAKWVNAYEKHRGPFEKDKIRSKDVQNFLLSTDFFPDADESKPLRFVAYYDPYVSPCYNPLRYAD